MMGLGSLGNGGSTSSSSNLSALAPPFTVNRQNPKPNSNPLVHFNDSPYAGQPFNQTWRYPHSTTPRPDFFSNIDSEVDSIRTTSLPLADDYQIINWSTLNPSAKTVTNAYSYPVEAESYYPPYMSPVGDNASPLVSLNEPSYDLLSTSGLAHVDVSPQVDYTQNLASFEYTPQWGGLWNGSTDGKRGKPVELDWSFCLEEKNGDGSLLYKNYMQQGARTDEGRSKCGEDFASSLGKCTDVSGTTNYTGSLSTVRLDEKSFFGQNASFIPFESSRTSILGAGSVVPESHSQTPYLKSATNSLNHQKPYNPLEKWLQPLDSYMNDCVSVTRSSTAVVIKPPAFGSSTSPLNKVSPKSVNIGNVAALKHGDFNSHNFSKGKEPCLPPNSEGKEGLLGTSQLGFHTEKNDRICVASSSSKDERSNKPLLKDRRSNARSAFQVSDINVPDSFYITSDTPESVKSTENSSDCLDHHNAAEDSPCWKGASGVHFSPFEVFETPTKQHLANKKDTHLSLNLQGSQIFPPYNDCAKASSPKLCETSMDNGIGYIDNCLSLCPKKTSDANFLVKELKSGDAVKAGDNYLKLSDSIGVLSSDENDNPRKKYDFPYESKSDFNIKASHSKQLIVEEKDRTCTELKLQAGFADTGLNTSDVSEDGHVPFHVVENVVSSPSSVEDATEIAKPHGRETAPIMNIQILVNAMHNFSELLLFHCSNDVCGLKEQDCEALKHVINILDVCMSRKIVNVMPTQASVFPQQGTSRKVEESPGLYVGASASQPQVNKADLHGQLGFRHMPEERRNSNVSDKKVEKSPDFVSLRDDAEVSKDKMVQGIKKLLNENLNDKEEGQSRTLLYKNLWLEAEAELCSTGYKARFDRMKVGMDKSKGNKAKDNTTVGDRVSSSQIPPDPKITSKPNKANENNTVVEKVSRSVISPDPKMTSKANKANENTTLVEKVSGSEIFPAPKITSLLTPEVKESPPLKNSMQDFRSSFTTNHVDDVEAAVMTRFHILKSRDDKSNSINMTQQQLPEVVDTGFAGDRNRWPFIEHQSEDGCIEAALGPHLQHSIRNGNVKNDLPIQSDRNNNVANQHPFGWYDNSSSDWEQVLEDEFFFR